MLIEQRLAERLEKRRQAGNFRQLICHQGVDFASNDYLGLARSQELKADIVQAQQDNPLSSGATGSRLLSGQHSQTEALEQLLARMFRSKSALLFNSGYNLNLTLPECLCQEGDVILLDELVHASIRAGARLSTARVFSFRHNDLSHFRAKLQRLSADCQGQIFVITESVFSMDGDVAPLSELGAIARQYHAALIVDEAHGAGVMGADGLGLAADEADVFARVITFGKAFGSHGAALLSGALVRDAAINFCTGFIYTTALPPGHIQVLDRTFRYWEKHPELRQQLKERILLMNRLLGITEHQSAIYSFRFSCADTLNQLCQDLKDSGLLALPIRSPTVRRGTERLRVVLHVHNTEGQIVNLCQRLLPYESYWKKNLCDGD
ncbi:MAG: aminotransferase class I/II-fold pyridoxal phosphate-dependent enzyme [Deltaproteobacteria bacterium]|nr:aminotransferase class I/II-fold pyridoxal phosphate-dependent enzyme [Deltaproteobacteria bacterium]